MHRLWSFHFRQEHVNMGAEGLEHKDDVVKCQTKAVKWWWLLLWTHQLEGFKYFVRMSSRSGRMCSDVPVGVVDDGMGKSRLGHFWAPMTSPQVNEAVLRTLLLGGAPFIGVGLTIFKALGLQSSRWGDGIAFIPELPSPCVSSLCGLSSRGLHAPGSQGIGAEGLGGMRNAGARLEGVLRAKFILRRKLEMTFWLAAVEKLRSWSRRRTISISVCTTSASSSISSSLCSRISTGSPSPELDANGELSLGFSRASEGIILMRKIVSTGATPFEEVYFGNCLRIPLNPLQGRPSPCVPAVQMSYF